MMKELSVKELLNRYSFLSKMKDKILFIDKTMNDIYNNDEKIIIKSDKISIKLLQDILDKDDYFCYIKKLFDGQLATFNMKYIINGDTAGGVHLTKIEIVKALKKGIKEGKIVINDSNEKKLDFMFEKTSLDNFKSKTNNEVYKITVDNVNFSFLVTDILSFLELSNIEYASFFNLEFDNTINGVPKEYFIYAVIQYIKDVELFDSILVPDSFIKRYKELLSNEKIDIEAINEIQTIDDRNEEMVQLNTNLEREILSGIPDHFNELEKAIYIYIKLCKILTYDEEFYLFNQKGKVAKKHENIDNIKNIDCINNRVVCYDFNAIYAKFLLKTGLKYEIYSKVLNMFGGGHANLIFRSGKYLVEADSVTSIINGDIMQAKLNQPLKGLKCINENEDTKEQFESILSKVYKYIALQHDGKSQVEHIETFDEIVSEYKEISSKIEIKIEEKIEILIDKVNRTNFIGIDAMSYVLQLAKIIFSEEERKSNFKITIIKRNLFEDKSIANAVFCLNISDNMYYYLYSPHDKLLLLDKKELKEYFSSGVIEYIDNGEKIPGLDMERGKKKC